MSPRARLVIASSVASIGALVAVVGSRLAWWVAERPGSSFILNGRRTQLPGAREVHRVADVLPSVGGIAVAIFLLSLLAWLLGARARGARGRYRCRGDRDHLSRDDGIRRAARARRAHRRRLRSGGGPRGFCGGDHGCRRRRRLRPGHPAVPDA
ncbi:MAG: hypothetical protein ABR552_04790 [Actinomycetota bacterium]